MALVTDLDGHTNRQARTRTAVVPSIRCGFVGHLSSVIPCRSFVLGPQRARENSVVPAGLESFFPLFPALKRWAKFGRPSGAGFSTGWSSSGCRRTRHTLWKCTPDCGGRGSGNYLQKKTLPRPPQSGVHFHNVWRVLRQPEEDQ